MKGDIIAKLNSELSEPILAERQVVYILVELRKLMEINDDAGAYPALRFHCDWAVHSKLKGPAAQELVRLFDANQKWLEVKGSKGPGLPAVNKWVAMLRLSAFRNELDAYLTVHQLPTTFVTSRASWNTFVRYYARVVEDCPLKCVSQGLKYVDEVVLTLEHTIQNPRPGAEHLSLIVRWSWTSKTTGQPQFTESEF